jgi:hypothetical protein
MITYSNIRGWDSMFAAFWVLQQVSVLSAAGESFAVRSWIRGTARRERLVAPMALKPITRGRNRTEGFAGTYRTQKHNRTDMGSPTDGEENVVIGFILASRPPFGGLLFGMPTRQLIF